MKKQFNLAPKLSAIFESKTPVKLVYFFGSKAKGEEGPLSDYDFGIYIDQKNKKDRSKIKLQTLSILTEKLKTDKVDVVVLNDAVSPELKYNIINEGKLIYEKEPYKVIIEPKILNEYFDFHQSLKKYNLTKG